MGKFTLPKQGCCEVFELNSRLTWGEKRGDSTFSGVEFPILDHNANSLKQLEVQVDKESMVLFLFRFLCRSAQRSHHAAELATEHGFNQCYNILERFEGDKDANQQRGIVGGWRKFGLPWTQS